MRRVAHNGVVKTLAAGAQKIAFVGGELPPGTRGANGASSLIKHCVSLQGSGGANNLFSYIDRIRVKANGVPIWDIDREFYGAWIERHMACTDYSPGSSATKFTLYYNDPSQATNELADASSCFPYDATPTIEFDFNASTLAGKLLVQSVFSDREAPFYPSMFGNAMNIPGSSTSGFFQYTEEGLVRGLAMKHAGIDRVQLTCSDIDLYNGAGPAYGGAASTNLFGNPIVETQADELYVVNYANHVWFEVHGVPAQFGRSNVKMVTTSDWGGVGNELTIYAMRAQAPMVRQ